MPAVNLPSTLIRHSEGATRVEIPGDSVAEVLRHLQERFPALRGWILDERSYLREHVSVFVNAHQADLGHPLEPTDELHVVQAISGGSAERVEVLVGTRKGLISLTGERGGPLAAGKRAFAGQVVEYACKDPRTGLYYASVTHGQFGPHLYFTDDPGGEWEEASGLSFPAEVDDSVQRIWVVQAGEQDGELWAGVAPAALFQSTDSGRTWELNRGLWDHPTRPDWQAGAGGMCLHSICPWPGDPARLSIGISAAGVWHTEDGGATWSRGVAGLVPRYLPEEAREDAIGLCVHKLLRAVEPPTRMFLQFHGGVYRSDDAGQSWSDIGTERGLPSDFGFPMVLDPRDPDRAWVIPLVADVDRVTPEGRLRVYETADAGSSWVARAEGLPQEDAHLTILRQAFCHDGGTPLGLYFGATSGELFGSFDGGRSWATLARRLPPVGSVTAVTSG